MASQSPFAITSSSTIGSLPNEVYTGFSFVGFLMCAIPFYWHMQAWNTGTCLYMAWIGLGCLTQCINSIVWNKNMVDRARVYCFISTRIQAGLNVGFTASLLCIVRRLYKIVTMKNFMETRAEKRREIMIDLLIGLGIPILEMIFSWIVSDNVYFIYEDFGPMIESPLTTLSLALYFSWPVVIGVVSFTYSSRTVYILYRRGRELQIFLPDSSFNRSLYFRVMALAFIDILGSTPLTTYVLVRDLAAGVKPWTGWANTHSDYSTVPQVPSSFWRGLPNVVNELELFRWWLVAFAFINFAFFGFAEEARRHYRLVYTWLATARSGEQAI
ncbi:GPCR fungal pheromone mating factor [Russula compacta]|nr:GPCR fungal pheromone mating factor [Russula compacta]